jgi:hypothetical protein
LVLLLKKVSEPGMCVPVKIWKLPFYPRNFWQIRPAPIQPMTRITPGAGIVVGVAGAGGWVGGMVGGVVVGSGGGLVTTCVVSVVAGIVTGKVTGALVVTGTGSRDCTGTAVVDVVGDKISGLTLWINRLPWGSTGVFVLPGML